MNKKLIIRKTEEFVKKTMKGDSGHGFDHVNRVRNNALFIAKKEKADLFVVELAALLHDIADWKFTSDEQLAGKIIRKELSKYKVGLKEIDSIVYIVENISYKDGTNKHKMKTLEGKVVQDADRLDALGAVGIARVFAYGGYKNRPIHDPSIKPYIYKSFNELKNSKRTHTSINHFYEKLLFLKNFINTKTGKNLALHRHKYLEDYLKQFLKEWKGLS